MAEFSENKDAATASSLTSAFLEHKRTLAAYLAYRALPAHEIEDMLQDAFLETYVAEKRQVLKSPKAYLFIVIRNLLSKRISKQSKMIVNELDDALIERTPSSEAAVDDGVYQKLRFDTFLEAVDTLPPQCRKVFLLRKVAGYSHKKISRELSISTSTVERHITDALTKLNTFMARQGYEGVENKMNSKRQIRGEE